MKINNKVILIFRPNLRFHAERGQMNVNVRMFYLYINIKKIFIFTIKLA